MAKRYRVRLKEDWRWPTAQVQGREFTKESMELQEVEVTEEIRNSPLLVVEEVMRSEDPISEGVQATDAAIRLAEEAGIPLGSVVGTGAGGRVTKRDVEAVLDG